MRVLTQAHGDNWHAYHADCVEVLATLPDNSVDFSVFSPPFSSLYIYSDSERDMGNVEGDEAFQAAYAHVARELYRVMRPGRLAAIHVKDLVYYSNASDKGDRGLRDFTGSCIRTHIEQGWTLHSRHTVWRCPVREMQKAKPDGLLFKNFRTDAARVRAGLPEYIVAFRKWAPGMEETKPVLHDWEQWREWGGADVSKAFGVDDYAMALSLWQQWASPVWMDTDETKVLNARIARDDQSEKHLCPMPLDLIDRCIRLWSNPGDVVLSPFMGVGSEGFGALKAGRKFIGVELKEAYFKQAVRFLKEAEAESASGLLLDLMGAAGA